VDSAVINFQLVTESILGMIRRAALSQSSSAGGASRKKEVTVKAELRTILAILLDCCRAGHRQRTRILILRTSARTNCKGALNT
jgi:hypothetical protein